MKLEPGTFCPLIQDDCKGLQCSWFTQVRGINPNTGKEVDEWACAVTWIPMLVIETSQQQRQAGAAIESLRNTICDNQRAHQATMLEATCFASNPSLPH